MSKILFKIIQNTNNWESKIYSQKKINSTVNYPKMIQILELIVRDFKVAMRVTFNEVQQICSKNKLQETSSYKYKQ